MQSVTAWALLAAPLCVQDVPELTQRPAVNATCPILEDEPNDPALTFLYKGVAVGLCCEDCQRKFLRDPERYCRGTPELAAAYVALDGSVDASAPAPADPPPADPEARGFLDFAGRFHPLTVHFPIALLLAAALGELLVLMGWPGAATGAAFAHRLGTLGALVAAPLGLALAATTEFAPSLQRAVAWHQWLGIAAAGLAAVSLVLAEVSRRGGPGWTRPAYRLLLLAAAGVVAAAGHFGAELIWGSDFLPF
ncbi:MAG: hypothetical protein EYC70_12020 [Planctomycetota bacterium]|nr:MAG: hypothetical protein EYC70_12020 [Planctomycetota bacterium]